MDNTIFSGIDESITYGLVLPTIVFDNLSGNELVVDLPHRHRIVHGENLLGLFDDT